MADIKKFKVAKTTGKVDKRHFNGGNTSAGRKPKEELLKDFSIASRRSKFLQSIKDEDFYEVVNLLMQKAKLDVDAAKYIIDQVIGKPMQVNEISGLGQSAIQIEIIEQVNNLNTDL